MRLDAQAQGLRWLEQAEADRHGAQLLFDGESYHLACFIAQQVAEKALKAFLVQTFRRSNVETLKRYPY